ncbi:hypothetical protein H8K33_00375 [Undibacterium amnicola]|uniref:Uncharacterized protein n=1 Tax=Undibacterium amnicola TaxID=1834038 RepID=A0ABR6XKN3_9BURK|nr:hypothetical protein [Undibacterium amnicola]MBC3829956.1 hypothetical protein [Undibacterium amnicola]
MARYKIVDRNPKFIPVVLDAQLITGAKRDCIPCNLRQHAYVHPTRH